MMTLIISIGRWGGFYFYKHRICLGFIAFTFYGKDYDAFLDDFIDYAYLTFKPKDK